VTFRFWHLAALGSAALLVAALGSQYLGGLAPCKMCIWQRWPHLVAVLAGLVLLFTRWRGFALVGFAAALSTSGIGFFHAGVEQGWWEGPSTCSAPSIGSLSTEALLDQIMNAPVVRCDEIAWSFAGLSMAAWNGVLSLGLAGLWALSLRQSSNSASQ